MPVRKFRAALADEGDVYRAAARRIADIAVEGPVVVACSLGQDRTGLAVGLLLVWLGADPADTP